MILNNHEFVFDIHNIQYLSIHECLKINEDMEFHKAPFMDICNFLVISMMLFHHLTW